MRKAPEFHLTRHTLPWTHFTPLQLTAGSRARYPDCYRFTLEYEGGYVNDPDDPGGCTNMGITIGTLQDWREDPGVTCADVAVLSEHEASLIYTTNYWVPVWGSYLPVGLNLQVWDFGVNSGPSRAITELQILVGAFTDGLMGPNTLEATRERCALKGVGTVIAEYSRRRQVFYESLSTFEYYGTGWTSRNEDCRDLGVQMAADGPNTLVRPGVELPKVITQDLRLAALEAWAASFRM